MTVSKSAIQNLGFLKTEYLIKTVKQFFFFEKIKCLVNTYKSGVLSYKLQKMTKFIYKGVYFILSIKFSLTITTGIKLIIITSC